MNSRTQEYINLGQLGIFSKGTGITKSQLKREGRPCIRYGEIYTTHHYHIKGFKSYISEECAENAKEIKNGDVLFAGSGETIEEIGKAVTYLRDETAYAGGDIVIFTPKEDIDSGYLSYFLNSEIVQRQTRRLGQGNSVVHIYARDLARISIVKPPLAEQKKIYKILTCWDDAIHKTEQLIAVKEKRFQWLLSKSLNNKLLPHVHVRDFSKEVSRRNRENECERVLSVTNDRGFVLPTEQFERNVASSNLTNYKIVEHGQYAYNPSRINVGSIARLDDWEKGVLSPMYVVFKVDESKVDSDFLLHWLSSYGARHRIKRSAQGSVRETVSFQDFASIKYPLPKLDKQKEVSRLLNMAKREIDLFKKQVANYRKQKRGLMQKLLTGEWGVKVSS